MEKVVRSGEGYLYGSTICKDANSAYSLWRDDYHKSLGRAVFRRLDRVPWRSERVHGFGFDFAECCRPSFREVPRTDYRLMGILSGSYCRIIGCWDYPQGLDDDSFWQWLDAAFSRNSGMLRHVGKNVKFGRTSGKKIRKTKLTLKQK